MIKNRDGTRSMEKQQRRLRRHYWIALATGALLGFALLVAWRLLLP